MRSCDLQGSCTRQFNRSSALHHSVSGDRGAQSLKQGGTKRVKYREAATGCRQYAGKCAGNELALNGASKAPNPALRWASMATCKHVQDPGAGPVKRWRYLRLGVREKPSQAYPIFFHTTFFTFAPAQLAALLLFGACLELCLDLTLQ